MKAKFIALSLLALSLAGCQSGMISVDAISGTLTRVADRDDKYVNADPTLTPAQKANDLRDTALLRNAIQAAKPTTQPAR